MSNQKIKINIKIELIIGADTMTMYSNYLTEVGKLVYILGQIESTSSFKKMLDNNDPKSKIFFKCLDELPPATYKKIKVQCRRKGILRCDWFSKILDKSPMMIFMIFNYTQPLDANQKWQDRLSLTIRKINKVYDVLRNTNKQDTILRIIVIISKQAVLQSSQSGNIQEKITNFLKNYEKQLIIMQSDLLSKQVAKNKTSWFTMLERAYERKYKAISKRKDDSFSERRLGCLIKMAVISQIINKKDSYSQYDEAYRSVHFRFVQTMKGKIEFFNFDAVRQLRTMADIVMLRRLIVKMAISSNLQSVAQTISNHLRFFYQVPQSDHFFFSYENILWRQNFLQNLLQVLYTNDHIETVPRSYFAQLINSAISLSFKLCRSQKQLEPILNKSLEIKGRMIPSESPVYIGSRNYTIGVEITDLDVIWTEMNQLMQRKKDFVTRGLQTITRYKSLKIFKKHQLSFFNVYLLRFYLADEKFSSIGNIFDQIIKMKISQFDFYSLNHLIDELEKQTQKSSEHRTMIHSLAVLIADYFRNVDQLETYGILLMNSLQSVKAAKKSDNFNLLDLSHQELPQKTVDTQVVSEKQPLVLPLQSGSLVFSLQILFPDKLHTIEKPLEITITPKFQNKFLANSGKKAKLKIFFNKSQIQYEHDIIFNQLEKDQKIVVKINPLQYFSKDDLLQIQSAVLITQTTPALHFFVDRIQYPKHSSVILITKLSLPEISIVVPYDIYYLYETSKIMIKTQKINASTRMEMNFTVTQEGGHNTEIFMNLNERLNLVNSGVWSPAQNGTILFLKGNKIGERVLKFVFNVTLVKAIGGKELRDMHTVNKDIGFRVVNLFKTIKQIKESNTGAQLKPMQIPTNKTLIMSYTIRSVQAIQIIQLNQHKSPKSYFKSHKNIAPVQNYLLKPEERLKSIYIFQILQEFLKNQEKKELFLISFYIKWQRTDMDKKLGLQGGLLGQDIVNVYNEDQVKVGVRGDRVQVGYEEGKVLKKRIKNTLSIKYRNLTGQRVHVYSIMDNSEDILRIGSRANEVELGPKQTKTITFQILPVKTGYFKYPQVRSFFDGIEAKQKTCNSIICVV